MPQKGKKQNKMHKRPLCLQRMSYAGNWQSDRLMSEWNIQKSCRDTWQVDVYAILPYARPRASYYGGNGAADCI